MDDFQCYCCDARRGMIWSGKLVVVKYRGEVLEGTEDIRDRLSRSVSTHALRLRYMDVKAPIPFRGFSIFFVHGLWLAFSFVTHGNLRKTFQHVWHV